MIGVLVLNPCMHCCKLLLMNMALTQLFKQCTTTDCATIQTKILPVDDFIDCFMGMLKELLLHDYTAKMQSSFMQQTKESLKPGVFLVLADFSENYSSVIQDEVQSFHWNNSSATVHPFVWLES